MKYKLEEFKDCDDLEVFIKPYNFNGVMEYRRRDNLFKVVGLEEDIWCTFNENDVKSVKIKKNGDITIELIED